jgi:glycosyltransferase involved in cell wall biosynthesis
MLRRVLIAYTSQPPIIAYLKAAFARRGIEVKAVFADENTWFDRFVIHRLNKLAHNLRVTPKSKNFFEDHPLSHMNFRSTQLRSAIAAYDPDLVFLIRGLGFRSWAVEEARTKFAWWVEADERVDEALSEVAQFDRYFFINSSSVEAARRAGYGHTSYLPHAVDASVFRPIADVAKDIDFCFVGLWSEERQRFIEAALDVSENGAVYGPKWYQKTFRDRRFRRIVKGGYIGGEPLVQLYNRTKIVVNVTNWGANAGTSRSGMTMRLFEVPATGSFLLTDHSAETDLAVTPGLHVETFSDFENFTKKMRFYLNDAPARERIATQGMQHVRAQHSYDRMVDSILAAYEDVQTRESP